jgi:uncharacterized repeat protein (TIGR03803 family)
LLQGQCDIPDIPARTLFSKGLFSVMKFVPTRVVLLLALVLLWMLPARVHGAPVFLTGTATGSANPYYPANFSSVPVGKTLVIPIAISGTSAPMSYSVTSSSPSLIPVVKTGCPVMNIHVTYSGTSGSSSTLYSFTGGNDGGTPYAGLVTGSDGNLYGTTETDGSSGYGTIYQLTTSGSLNTLHAFTSGTDGANPYCSLLSYTGLLFGTAEAGSKGYGTVYELNTSGTSGSFYSLYSFTGGTDGANPYGALVSGTTLMQDGTNNTSEPEDIVLGTTKNGGANSKGTVFLVTFSGSFQSLYSFTGGTDGANPVAGLVQSIDGNYYGTTIAGGSNSKGTVYRLSVTGTFANSIATTSGSLTPIYSFSGGADGGVPYGGVIQVTDGNLYGATETGGTSGYGTLYRITTSGSLTTLYTFGGGSDGANPYAPLVEGTDGYLYGATETGGTNGYGTVFQLSLSGSLKTLFSLAPSTTGANPYGGLYPKGNVLYGTASTSGSGGHGTVYQIPLPNAGAFQGTMRFALLRDMAPTTVGYIAGFAQAGYYNGLDFFRITNLSSTGTDGYIAQGGDPSETGSGTLGFTFNNELKPSLIFTGYGQLAMANSGNDSSTFQGTNGSQFFFTGGRIRALDFGYTIFGQLLTGFDVMQNVLSVPLQSDGSSPVQPVVMDSVTVTPNNTDAVMLVSASGYLPSATLKVTATSYPGGVKAVLASGTTQVAGPLTISLSTPQMDIINDPPIIVPEADVTVPLHQSATVPIRSQDLEFDYLLTSAFALDASDANVTQSGDTAIVTLPASLSYGGALVGMETYQPYVSVDRSSAYDVTAVNVYIGTGKLSPTSVNFIGEAGSPVVSSTAALSGTATNFGSFLSANPQGTAADYTGVINWGDGTLSTGTADGVTIAQAGSIPTEYAVSGSGGHVYSQPGTYTVNVTVSGSNGGAVQFQNTAVVSAGPVYAFGRTFTAPAGLANAQLATFIDKSPNLKAADYEAIINWGDGTVSLGSVTGANGAYSIYGRHQYTGGTTYPVDVTVQSLQNLNNTAHAWTVAKLTGVPPRQPPFAQSHLTGQIGNPGFDGLYLSEEVALVNSGNIASGPVSLKFYISPTSSVSPISSSAIALSVAGNSTYNTPSIPAGQSIQGSVSKITLPNNINSRGMYIIMQVITSDPIGNHMVYPRAFADSYPLIE